MKTLSSGLAQRDIKSLHLPPSSIHVTVSMFKRKGGKRKNNKHKNKEQNGRFVFRTRVLGDEKQYKAESGA